MIIANAQKQNQKKKRVENHTEANKSEWISVDGNR